MALGLLAAAIIASMIGLVGVCIGPAIGSFADRLGHRRAVMASLVLIAAASGAGAVVELVPATDARVARDAKRVRQREPDRLHRPTVGGTNADQNLEFGLAPPLGVRSARPRASSGTSHDIKGFFDGLRSVDNVMYGGLLQFPFPGVRLVAR